MPRSLPFQIFYFDELTSTQDRARELLTQYPDGVWVRSVRQTQGRGRHQRSWMSQEGDLLLSCAFPLEKIFLGKAPFLSLLAAQALWEALGPSHELEDAGLFIKWPNDLYVENSPYGKVAGILAELKSEKAVIGWGVNMTPRRSTAGSEPWNEKAIPQVLPKFLSAPRDAQELQLRLVETFERLLKKWKADPENFQNFCIETLSHGAMKRLWGRPAYLSSEQSWVQLQGLRSEGSLIFEKTETPKGDPSSIRGITHSGELTLAESNYSPASKE